MQDKKHEERVVVSFLLKQVAPHALPGLCCNREEPDCLTLLGQKKLGIEVRSLRDDLMSGSDALAATEGAQDKVVVRAQQLYENRQLPAAIVYVTWKPAASPCRNTQAVAEAIVNAVVPEVATPLPASGFKAAIVDGTKLPNVGIARLRIYRTARATRASWFSLRGGWAKPCPPSAIQRALDEKEMKLPAYRKKARTVWLAMTILGGPSSALLLPPTTLHQHYRSSFDRAFLVDLSRERVHELQLKK